MSEENTTFNIVSIPVVVRHIERDAPGFLPRYRAMLACKRVISDFSKALPEDVDEAYRLLMEHIVSPETDAEKMDVLNKVSPEELLNLLNAILGVKIVPPAKGAA